MVPFLDLKAQYLSIKEEIDEAISRVLESSAFVLGRELESFEEQFAAYCGIDFAVGVGNGTDALMLALRAVGIGEGDEVITTPNTFIATAEAIVHAGARPVFVDADEKTGNIAVDKIEKEITPRTRAIMPVHLYGRPAEMAGVREVADRHGLKLIEDACQAHGAVYRGKKAGTIGDAGCFSFYPGKNLGGYGDGGMVVTADPRIAENLRLLRDHGSPVKYEHRIQGFNSRLDCLQAAVLKVKLKRLDAWNGMRNKWAKLYGELLKDGNLLTPTEVDAGSRHVFHLYVVRTGKREVLIKRLKEAGIGFGIHYPRPIHLQAAFSNLGYHRGDFPVAERLSEEILSLPIYAEMGADAVREVAAVIKEFFQGELLEK